DGLYIIHDGEAAIIALDVATGAGRWERPLAGISSHAFAGKVLVVADPLAVRGIDPQSNAVLWRHQTHGPSLVAPLDEARALVHFPSSVCTIDATTGAFTEHARHQLHDTDDTLDARAGSAVVMTDGGTAHWFRLEASRLVEVRLGEVVARPGAPAVHGIKQAAIIAAGVITFNTAGELQRFGA
ncbi:MAG TPA: PQQ-binding-like beta-propeller repeat protein, partial [Kofleriaceae bacterium]|nr:PQQ-binding-like beta-propeller repeat protein [Kofleriaceae bacterium]